MINCVYELKNKIVRYYNSKFKENMDLKKLVCVKKYHDNMFFDQPDTIVTRIYHYQGNVICKIIYGLITGTIESIFVRPPFRGLGLGKQMLEEAISEMKFNGVKHVYALSKKNNLFWNKVHYGVKNWEIHEYKSKNLGFGTCYFFINI